MLLGREMRAGGGRSTASGGRWSSEHGGGVVPVGFGRGEGAGKLRKDEAERMVGLAWVERVCGGGLTAGVSSSEFKRGGGGVLRWGSTEKAKGGEE